MQYKPVTTSCTGCLLGALSLLLCIVGCATVPGTGEKRGERCQLAYSSDIIQTPGTNVWILAKTPDNLIKGALGLLFSPVADDLNQRAGKFSQTYGATIVANDYWGRESQGTPHPNCRQLLLTRNVDVRDGKGMLTTNVSASRLTVALDASSNGSPSGIIFRLRPVSLEISHPKAAVLRKNTWCLFSWLQRWIFDPQEELAVTIDIDWENVWVSLSGDTHRESGGKCRFAVAEYSFNAHGKRTAKSVKFVPPVSGWFVGPPFLTGNTPQGHFSASVTVTETDLSKASDRLKDLAKLIKDAEKDAKDAFDKTSGGATNATTQVMEDTK